MPNTETEKLKAIRKKCGKKKNGKRGKTSLRAIMKGLPADRPLRIGLVAGEASGDNLGAALIEALRARHGSIEFFGVAGPRMAAAGCRVWEPADAMGKPDLTAQCRYVDVTNLLRQKRTANASGQ